MFGFRPLRSIATLAVLVVLSGAPFGCSAKGSTFVDSNASYDQASVMALAAGVDTAQLAKTPSDQAPDLRHEALTELRSRGGRAIPVADMITKTFPAQTRGVPVYFERATFGGKPAVVVIEAAGPAKGKLTTKRVWVLDENGGVLFVGNR